MLEKIPRVFNFSGGKTSAFMTIKYYKEGDIVLFCDTGREHTKTYKFIEDFERFEGINVQKISYDPKNPKNSFNLLLQKKNYKILPNITRRFCTTELKIKVQKRYLRSIGIRRFYNFVGFRSDEPMRVKRRLNPFKNVIDVFPLYENGITKKEINDYFEKKPYNLEIPSILGNCTLCFMKGKNTLINILTQYPELADEWIKDEEEAQKNGKFGGHTYIHNTEIKQLKYVAQNNLFTLKNLENATPQFTCGCTN